MCLKFAVTVLLAALLLDDGRVKLAIDSPGESEKKAEGGMGKAETAAQSPAPSPQPPAPNLNLHEVEQQIIEQTNAQRARYGLPPLVVDRQLVQSARTHTAWMTNNRSLQHTSRPVAENIAMGQRTTGEAIGSWMNSPGHRANILNSGHRRIGVAAYRTPDGTIYWCQQFTP